MHFRPFGIDFGALCDSCLKTERQKLTLTLPKLLVTLDSEITDLERKLESKI